MKQELKELKELRKYLVKKIYEIDSGKLSLEKSNEMCQVYYLEDEIRRKSVKAISKK